MASPVVVLLERCVMFPTQGGWKKVSIAGPSEAVAPIAEEFSRKTIRLVYEPDTLTTESVQCAPAKRGVVGQFLAKKHPAIEQETTAWGFLEPLPQGGKHTALLSVDSGSTLFDLTTSLRAEGVMVEAAFPLGAILPKSGSKGVGVVLVDEESGAVGVLRRPLGARIARRVGRGQGEPLDEVWSALGHCFGEAGLTEGSAVNVYTTGVEIPADLTRSYGLSVSEWDSLQTAVRNLPVSSAANLLGSFPLAIPLRKAYAGAALISVLVALGLSGAAWYADRSATIETRRLAAEKAKVERGLERARVRKGEVDALTAMYKGEISEPRFGRAEFLKAVAEALPRNCTLTALHMSDNGNYRLEGVFLFATETDTKDRLLGPILTSLGRSGYTTDLEKKATYTAGAARFTIEGDWHPQWKTP